MATVTGMTAEEADTRLGMSVVSGTINESGHLILTRANGSTIDAGDFTSIVTDILESVVEGEVASVVPDAIAGTVVDKGSISGAVTFVEFNNVTILNAMIKATLTGDITVSTADLPSSPKPNTQFAMRLTQDATGGRTITLTGFKKSMGVLPLTATANAIDIVVFLYDGSQWFAGLMGADFK